MDDGKNTYDKDLQKFVEIDAPDKEEEHIQSREQF